MEDADYGAPAPGGDYSARSLRVPYQAGPCALYPAPAQQRPCWRISMEPGEYAYRIQHGDNLEATLTLDAAEMQARPEESASRIADWLLLVHEYEGQG